MSPAAASAARMAGSTPQRSKGVAGIRVEAAGVAGEPDREPDREPRGWPTQLGYERRGSGGGPEEDIPPGLETRPPRFAQPGVGAVTGLTPPSRPFASAAGWRPGSACAGGWPRA